jgi:hypothetical protein
VVIFAQLNAKLAGIDVIIGLGVTNGMNLNSGTIDSGAAFGDRNGILFDLHGNGAFAICNSSSLYYCAI